MACVGSCLRRRAYAPQTERVSVVRLDFDNERLSRFDPGGSHEPLLRARSSVAATARAVSGSIWVIAGASGDVSRFAAAGWVDPPLGPVLTDDYSDLLRTLRP